MEKTNVATHLHNVTPEQLSEMLHQAVKKSIGELVKLSPPQPSQSKELLTREETAQFFNISKFSLYTWIKKGILMPCKISGRVYFKRCDLEKLTQS